MHTREFLLANKQPQTTIGVLTDHELLLHDLFADGKRTLRTLLLPLDATKASELLMFLWHAGLSVLWVMPTTRWSQTLTSIWFRSVESQWAVIVRSAAQEPERPLSVLLWPKGNQRSTARQLIFAFPEHAGWGWQLADATSLLATVTYLERILARSVSDGPALVAQQLLSDLTASWRPQGSFASSLSESSGGSVVGRMSQETIATTIPEGGRPQNTAEYDSGHPLRLPCSLDFAWMRPLTRVEQRQKYLHQYIHISYSLEACLRLRLPMGASEHSASGRAYDGSRPGLWRIRAERAGSIFDGKHLPSCLDGEWMSTPQVQCCRDIGYQVQVCEGFLWPQSQEFLQPWASALWQAAERTHAYSPSFKHEQGRNNTVSSLKLLAQLGMASLPHKQADGGWSPPEWWPHIIGGSRATLFAHLARLVKRGMMPILVNDDALWVVSDDPHPLTAVPGLFAVRQWNGYRVGYTVPLPLSREVREIFRTVDSPKQAAGLLDALSKSP